MSLFGKLDAANIRTNPFYIEAGEYPFEVTEAKYQYTREGQRQLKLTYQITDEDSAFYKKTATRFFDLPDENLTNEDLMLLPHDEQVKIERNNSAIKRELCGNEMNRRQKGLGVPVEDLNNADWKPETLVGIKGNMCITNWGEGNQGVNIKWVNTYDPELDD